MRTNSGEIAFKFTTMHNILIEGNYVDYASTAVYSDSDSTTNMTIINNQFLNCDRSLKLVNNHPHQNVSFCLNTINSPSEAAGTIAIEFDANPMTNVLIIGNTFTFTSSPGGASYPLYASAVTGLTFANNAIDSQYSFTNLIGCAEVNIYNNSDLFGAPSLIYNQIAPPDSVTRKSISSSYSALYGDKYLGMKANGLTITVPPAANISGKEITVADETGSSLASCSIAAASPNKINGTTSVGYSLSPYASITVISDGTNWFARRK
jgi:hypothetical protein